MPIKKYCSYTGCRTLVSEDTRYCERHRGMACESKKKADRAYKETRTDTSSQDLYISTAWQKIRDATITFYFGIDIYEYFKCGNIKEGQTVHHIIEVKEDWSKRLDQNNLLYLSEFNHKYIHKQYCYNKKKMQNELFDMIIRFYMEVRQGV